MDPGAKGPFEIQVQEDLDGLDTHIAIAPKELGQGGIKHPIVVWINGAGTSSTGYREMLNNVAAHGFFLLDDKQSSFESAPEVEAQRAAIDWVIEQAKKSGGPYFEKLDTTRIAIAGHSLGSVSTFGNAKDTRIKTSIHMAGGVTGNPEGVDESWLQDLHVPAAFFCGDRDTNGLPRCKNDFAAAPASVPLFFGMLAGVGHTDEFTKPNGGRWGRILVAWLRWQLVDDASFARSFEGSDCEFCKGDWTAMKHAID
jgi:predicted alpha/beta-hydrolase family hydrolase